MTLAASPLQPSAFTRHSSLKCPVQENPGSIPGLGRFPGEGNSNPVQYSFLENSIWRPYLPTRCAQQPSPRRSASVLPSLPTVSPKPLPSSPPPRRPDLPCPWFPRLRAPDPTLPHHRGVKGPPGPGGGGAPGVPEETASSAPGWPPSTLLPAEAKRPLKLPGQSRG